MMYLISQSFKLVVIDVIFCVVIAIVVIPFQTIDITVAYMDASGNLKAHKVKSSDLSSSWVWENTADGNHALPKVEQVLFFTLHFLVEK